MSRILLEKILAEWPNLHRGETETKRTISEQQTSLRGSMLQNILEKMPACHGIDPEVARFLFDSVSEHSKTLETGSGISTLAFAIRRSQHIAITPNGEEVANIRSYAAANHVSLDCVEFVVEPSDYYLPRCEIKDLDLVLIDGKHAFPWPIIDWFYTADRLKLNGILVLDDTEMPSVAILGDFLREDPRWQLERPFGRRTLAMRKTSESVHDVAWHMQPYITRRFGRRARVLNALGLHGALRSGRSGKNGAA